MKRIMNTLLLAVCLALATVSVSILADMVGKGIVPKEGFVPDEKTAIKIAEAVLVPVFGQQHIDEERPLKARLVTNYWVVRGTLRQPTNDLVLVSGGVAEVHINKSSGCILYMGHGK